MSEKGIDTMGESSLKTTEGSYQTKSSTQEHQEEFDTWSEDQGTNDDKLDSLGKHARRFDFADSRKQAPIYECCERDPNDPPRGQLKEKTDPDEVYSNQRIVNVIRIQYDQGHGQDLMMKIIVKRADVLKEVKKINLDVNQCYANPPLIKEDVDFIVFYEEDIQDRLRHRDQMRRWENYVNGRPLQQRCERLK
nr:hypothetical protein [Tanacetum cinerariifolium]